MDEKYLKIVIETAIDRLESSDKPLSENEFTRGLVAYLKKKLGKDDIRHSSKVRFRKEIFKYVIETSDWKEKIVQINNKKYALKIWVKDLPATQTVSDWDWSDIDLETAKEKVLNVLKKMDAYKFEHLIKDMIEEMYDYEAKVTQRSGDLGTDIIGYKDDPKQNDNKQVICAQVKRFKGTVGRGYADSFIGAVEFEENWSSVEGLFVTTGHYPDSFYEKLKRKSKEKGVYFHCWDGKQLVENLINLGWGVNYSIDLNFWNNLDSAIVPKEIKK